MTAADRLVLYHGRCIDGWTAAWAAWRLFGDVGTEYRAVHHGEPAPEAIEGREVYVLDFSYSREMMLGLRARARSLLVLDHHVTARDALAGEVFAPPRGGRDLFVREANHRAFAAGPSRA